MMLQRVPRRGVLFSPRKASPRMGSLLSSVVNAADIVLTLGTRSLHELSKGETSDRGSSDAKENGCTLRSGKGSENTIEPVPTKDRLDSDARTRHKVDNIRRCRPRIKILLWTRNHLPPLQRGPPHLTRTIATLVLSHCLLLHPFCSTCIPHTDTGIIHRVLCITLAQGTPSAPFISQMHMHTPPAWKPTPLSIA